MLTSSLVQDQIETSVARCFDLILNGGDSRARTDDPLLAKQVLSQLSYTPIEREVVGPSGLEPPTSRLSVVRSSQLSYGPVRVPSKLNNVKVLRSKKPDLRTLQRISSVELSLERR